MNTFGNIVIGFLFGIAATIVGIDFATTTYTYESAIVDAKRKSSGLIVRKSDGSKAMVYCDDKMWLDSKVGDTVTIRIQQGGFTNWAPIYVESKP